MVTEARWQWVEAWVGGEVSNIENSQQLGAKGEELCAGHRPSRGLVQDECKLKVDGKGL